MFWQESREETRAVPDDVVDIVYQINCRALPVDHAWALSQAVRAVLPWFADEPAAGVHPIHVADSGNGWMRPENAGDLLCLSRRTKLVLRVPRQRIDAAQALVGRIANANAETAARKACVCMVFIGIPPVGPARQHSSANATASLT